MLSEIGVAEQAESIENIKPEEAGSVENIKPERAEGIEKVKPKETEYKNCPIEGHGGTWEGERGDSKWIPDMDYVPPEKRPDKPYSNPDNLTMKEIMSKYGQDGIEFKNGYPDFKEISRGEVKIRDFETGGVVAKNHNFTKADIEQANLKDCSPDDVRNWRMENNYTWHECEDKATMQKVPNEVHANIPHRGGRSR